jgi:hypothetical protein
MEQNMSRNIDINASHVSANPSRAKRGQVSRFFLPSIVAIWGLAIVILAQAGVLSQLYPPIIGAIVAATIIIPTIWYLRSSALRRVIEKVGHRRIVIFHIWRIPAALLFFWYGAQGLLPPLFWTLAGIGDLIAGLYALWLSFRGENARAYLTFHRFGFADFVVAVGTGLTFTLLLDPRMAPIATLPLALIPLFGVGISGASHLMAFDMLRRDVGFQGQRSADTVML